MDKILKKKEEKLIVEGFSESFPCRISELMKLVNLYTDC